MGDSHSVRNSLTESLSELTVSDCPTQSVSFMIQFITTNLQVTYSVTTHYCVAVSVTVSPALVSRVSLSITSHSSITHSVTASVM